MIVRRKALLMSSSTHESAGPFEGLLGAGQPAPLDELDYLLITALQTSPRAEWAQIGKALGVDASTAARRWNRLTEAGNAWLSCYTVAVGAVVPIIAFIEVDCAAGALHEVAAEIADDPHLITIEHVTGARDLLLSEDFRQPAARLAERLGVSPTTVRRRLDRMHRQDALIYRCEVARYLSGWPISVTFWGVAPAGETSRIASQLIRMRETRLCASLTGPHNLMLTVWLRSAEDIGAFEARLTDRFPEFAVMDRAVALWQLKIAGHLLDPRGRHIRGVPVTFWEEPGAERAEEALLERLRVAR